MVNLTYHLFTKGYIVNKQKSQSGFAHLVLVIILIVALLGTLGFVYWQNYMQPKVSDTSQKTPVVKKDNSEVIPIAKTPAVVDPMADWKTYTNAKYGFSFKYPADWTVQESPTANGNSFPSPVPNTLLVKSPSGDDMRIWVNLEGGWGYELENFDTVNYTETASANGVALNGRDYTPGRAQEKSLGYTINLQFDYASNKYLIMAAGADPATLNTSEEIIKQIISTWKFN